MLSLSGKRVILTASRRVEEMTAVVQNLGGISIHRPIQTSVSVHQDVLQDTVRTLVSGGFDYVVFTTAIGAELIAQAAERIRRADDLRRALSQARIAVRGYKTQKYLETVGLSAEIVSPDGTTHGLIQAMSSVELNNRRVAIQLYGATEPDFVSWLSARARGVVLLRPYEQIAANHTILDALLDDVLTHHADALAFTSASQVEVLFNYAREQHRLPQLIQSLRDCVPVAVGKMTAGPLYEAGIRHVIVPETERMGSMLVELAKYYSSDFGSAPDAE